MQHPTCLASATTDAGIHTWPATPVHASRQVPEPISSTPEDHQHCAPVQAVDAASGTNLAMQAENARLRAELALMRQRLAEAGATQLLGSRNDAGEDRDKTCTATMVAGAKRLLGCRDDAGSGGGEASAMGQAEEDSAAAAEDSGAAADGAGQGAATAGDGGGKGEDVDDKGGEEETTPAKQPSAQTALASQAAAAHAAPVAFYGSHRVFMAPRTAVQGAASLAATPITHVLPSARAFGRQPGSIQLHAMPG